jgi:Spy/CpxP family protein refolding chaperone
MNFTRLLNFSRMPRTSRTSHTLAVAGLVLALGASLTPAKDHEGKHLDRMVARMEKELKLTKDQSAKIRTILAKDSATRPHRGEWKQDHDCKGKDDCEHHGKQGFGPGPLGGGEFTAQLRSSTVDTAALNRSFAERSDSMQTCMREHHARRVATFAEIHAVLTPEQRALAADKWEKRAADSEKKREKKSKK